MIETMGKLVDASSDFKTRKWRLTFEVDHILKENIDKLFNYKMLDIKLFKHYEKRSLTANNYHWKLCDLIAAELMSTKEEIHKSLMLSYGTPAMDKNGEDLYYITTKDYDPAINEYWVLRGEVHLTNKDGEEVPHNMWLVIKESRKYNTKEMSRLIDGTVYEAKELGIETKSQKEIDRLLERWLPEDL